MVAGDLTATHHGVHDISGSDLITAIAGINLTATTDNLHIIPTGSGQQVALIEVTRE